MSATTDSSVVDASIIVTASSSSLAVSVNELFPSCGPTDTCSDTHGDSLAQLLTGSWKGSDFDDMFWSLGSALWRD